MNPMNYKDPSGNVAIALLAGLILERVVDTAIETFVDVLIDMVLEGESFCFGKSAVEGLLINIVPFAGEASTSKKLAKLSTKYGDDIVLALRNTDEIVKHADEIIEVAKKDGVKGLQRYLSTFGKGIKGVVNFAKYGDEFGKMGKYIESPNIKVDWDAFAEHGWERMQKRGVTQDMVETWVKNGKTLSQNGGDKFAFITKEGVAVVSKDGKLITTWGADNFDDAMKGIVEQLYGK